MGVQYSYLTLVERSEGLYREKGSKFIAYAFPISNEDDFKHELNIVKQAHHQARHFCYAFVLGINGSRSRANDDGEPSGTAGKPILMQISGKGLTNTGVVVVRYFGGTKLGKGGLVRAYSAAAKEAFDKGVIQEIPIHVTRAITVSIDLGEKLKGRLLDQGCKIIEANYSDVLNLVFDIPLSREKQFARYCHDHGIDYRSASSN